MGLFDFFKRVNETKGFKEVFDPKELSVGDQFRMYCESLPYTMKKGWFWGLNTVTKIDFENERIYFLRQDTGENDERSFADTFYGYGGWHSMHCYKSKQSPSNKEKETQAGSNRKVNTAKFDKIIEPFTRSESGFYDEKLEQAKKEALKMILAEGSEGEKFLLDFLMRDVTVSGEYFNLKYYGDYANSEWYKKQKIVLALSCTTDKTIISKLSEILMLKGKENQFWTVFQPTVAETLGNLKEYSSLERYINSGQNVPAVLLSKDILRLYKAGVSEKLENKRDENGRMLLHNAVSKGDAELVQKLLADGADIDAVCSRGEELGETALYIAVVGKNLEIVKLLVKHEANLSAAAWNGTFPLQRAAAMGLFDVAKLLIDNGADKQQKTLIGKTALMWAEQNGYSNIAALLK